MPNTSTLVATTPRSVSKGPVYSYQVSIDTISNDLTLHTPASGNRAFLVGVVLCDSTANTITFKSGSTALCAPELAASTPIFLPVSGGGDEQWLLATAKGQALVINCSALLTNALFHVVEAAEL
jgi:hypothetical protein